jgi:glutamate-1-semialdehyde aminotransferase/spore coat polysaccharide biosynthesis protein SpsF (cytidylyltransferase family)
MKVVAVAIARMGSSRLPGKVMMKIGREEWARPVIQWVVASLKDTPSIDEVWVATTTEPRDTDIERWCWSKNVNFFRGSETDVLSRVYECAKLAEADVVVRVTCDCPFLDPYVIEQVIQLRAMTGADYASNVDPPTYADGLDCEAFLFETLEAAHLEAVRTSDRDCVTRFIARNRHRFKAETLINPIPGGHKERFVLDTENDLRLCRAIAERLPANWSGSHLDILRILDKEPELRHINAHHPRNERFYEQVATEERPAPKFDTSNALLERARKVIPLGSQTFSKSYIQYPAGEAPLFVTHGDGGYVFDVDGTDYVDMVCGLLPVILGYRDPDVDEAIRRQLNSGISFSTNTELEAELAELLCRLIPCAEMARFGKNGTDVTTAAVRAARAFTGRELVLLSGYHGWAGWSIWNTERNLGCPDEPSIRFDYGDYSAFVEDSDRIAAVIVEPNDNPAFLRWLRTYCTNRGIVLIFDEIITGFRYPGFSAQYNFDITPDLATFGKAMGNGMPINALVGRRDIMSKFEPPDNVFYSGTFQGETLSIAAAIACIKKLERENVPTVLAEKGEMLIEMLGELSPLDLTGPLACMKVKFPDDRYKTVFIREMIRRGVLTIGSFNLCYAHGEPELKRVAQAWGHIIGMMKNQPIDDLLRDTPVIGQVSVRAYR